MTLATPFPYFGGKSKVADIVWQRLGDVKNYVEPFFGSGAVLLRRPHPAKIETVNDADGMVSNFWRSVKLDPEAVARHADYPVNERDLEARHYWLVTEGRQRMDAICSDPVGYDAQVAGWWCWGLCSWIGSEWCAGKGPWSSDGGEWVDRRVSGDAGQGINRNLPHLGNAGRSEYIHEMMTALSDRLRDVRVCNGDWSRVCGPTPTTILGLTGVFLDPPYSNDDRSDCYAVESRTVSLDARAWAIKHGGDPLMRIAFCGYAGEFDTPWPDGWNEIAWKTTGGYGSRGNGDGRANTKRERIWFSPHCLSLDALRLL